MAFAQITYRESHRGIKGFLHAQKQKQKQALPHGVSALPFLEILWPTPTKFAIGQSYLNVKSAFGSHYDMVQPLDNIRDVGRYKVYSGGLNKKTRHP
ncbi:MAG: DUF4372 domain-containing protein [Proteobacteria bacterium]|jgi:hypothetical protein|nr:hypothetical protein [Desulfocapsa sp.]MBU3944249.1 DUF4372 domain-containing protein [Pseudomonadota bacterium]MBU4028243.1 DUF4372 domain-containing protein [Pseudomonadota bacterium]MBU4042088.1 DUF4372 domain-containing protein [Pseudomonadota bacterium]MBU4084360.1 DUF4372 domain-containing protein [Pseudomonadota bacterium]